MNPIDFLAFALQKGTEEKMRNVETWARKGKSLEKKVSENRKPTEDAFSEVLQQTSLLVWKKYHICGHSTGNGQLLGFLIRLWWGGREGIFCCWNEQTLNRPPETREQTHIYNISWWPLFYPSEKEPSEEQREGIFLDITLVTSPVNNYGQEPAQSKEKGKLIHRKHSDYR